MFIDNYSLLKDEYLAFYIDIYHIIYIYFSKHFIEMMNFTYLILKKALQNMRKMYLIQSNIFLKNISY